MEKTPKSEKKLKKKKSKSSNTVDKMEGQLNHTDYYNLKGWYSMIIQAIVYHEYIFRDICIGWPGSAQPSMAPIHCGNPNFYSRACLQQVAQDYTVKKLVYIVHLYVSTPLVSHFEEFHSQENSCQHQEL